MSVDGGVNALGKALGWIAVSTASLSLIATFWPLVMSITAFREQKSKYTKPSMTNYLNLICLSSVFLLEALFVILESVAFVQHDYYSTLKGYDLVVLVGIVNLVKTLATYSFALVVLDRYRIFGRIIKYPKITISIFHIIGLICFLISFISQSWIFAQRLQKPDDFIVPSWNPLKYAIQYFSVLLDIFVLTWIVWTFLKKLKDFDNSLFREVSHKPTPKTEKWQLIGLLALLFLLDIGALTLGFGTSYNRKEIAAVCQVIGENAFGFHIVIGLVILLKLKSTVLNQSVDLAAQVPDIPLSTKKINVIALPEDGHQTLSPQKAASPPYSPVRNSF